MIEQYRHLPGYEAVLLDGGMRVSEPITPTDSVLLIGTALDGPVGTMVRIRRPTAIEEVFGPYVNEKGKHNGATLGPAFHELYNGGARSIYAMRIGGIDATLDLVEARDDGMGGYEAGAGVHLVVKGRYPGSPYNAVKVELVDDDTDRLADKLRIWSRKDTDATNATKTYDLSQYETYRDLMEAVNEDSEQHDAVLVLGDDAAESDAITLFPMAKTALSGGDSQTNIVTGAASTGQIALGTYSMPGSYRGKLAEAYEVIKEFEIDWIVPTGVYVTYPQDLSGQPDWTDAQKLADLCWIMNKQEFPAKGVIGIAKLQDPTPARINQLADLLAGNTPNLVTEGEDSGRYISVVAAEATFFDTQLGVYSNGGAAIYAGLAASLPPHHATTNKRINILGQRWAFPKAKLDALTGAGYVTFHNKPVRGLVATDDPTAAARDSDYANLTTVRIAQDIVKLVRQLGIPYIGLPITRERRSAFQTDIQAALEARVRSGMINDFDFDIHSSIQGYLKGHMDVDVILVPAFVLKRLKITVALRPEI